MKLPIVLCIAILLLTFVEASIFDKIKVKVTPPSKVSTPSKISAPPSKISAPPSKICSALSSNDPNHQQFLLSSHPSLKAPKIFNFNSCLSVSKTLLNTTFLNSVCGCTLSCTTRSFWTTTTLVQVCSECCQSFNLVDLNITEQVFINPSCTSSVSVINTSVIAVNDFTTINAPVSLSGINPALLVDPLTATISGCFDFSSSDSCNLGSPNCVSYLVQHTFQVNHDATCTGCCFNDTATATATTSCTVDSLKKTDNIDLMSSMFSSPSASLGKNKHFSPDPNQPVPCQLCGSDNATTCLPDLVTCTDPASINMTANILSTSPSNCCPGGVPSTNITFEILIHNDCTGPFPSVGLVVIPSIAQCSNDGNLNVLSSTSGCTYSGSGSTIMCELGGGSSNRVVISMCFQDICTPQDMNITIANPDAPNVCVDQCCGLTLLEKASVCFGDRIFDTIPALPSPSVQVVKVGDNASFVCPDPYDPFALPVNPITHSIEVTVSGACIDPGQLIVNDTLLQTAGPGTLLGSTFTYSVTSIPDGLVCNDPNADGYLVCTNVDLICPSTTPYTIDYSITADCSVCLLNQPQRVLELIDSVNVTYSNSTCPVSTSVTSLSTTLVCPCSECDCSISTLITDSCYLDFSVLSVPDYGVGSECVVRYDSNGTVAGVIVYNGIGWVVTYSYLNDSQIGGPFVGLDSSVVYDLNCCATLGFNKSTIDTCLWINSGNCSDPVCQPFNCSSPFGPLVFTILDITFPSASPSPRKTSLSSFLRKPKSRVPPRKSTVHKDVKKPQKKLGQIGPCSDDLDLLVIVNTTVEFSGDSDAFNAQAYADQNYVLCEVDVPDPNCPFSVDCISPSECIVTLNQQPGSCAVNFIYQAPTEFQSGQNYTITSDITVQSIPPVSYTSTQTLTKDP